MYKPHPNQIDFLKLEKEHLTVLASAPCTEVFQAMSYVEPMSIREIALEVNRSTASVGEHIVKLLEVGLIVAVGTRKRRAREETLYAMKAADHRFDPVGQSEEATEACIKKFRCDLRQTDHMSAAAFHAIRKEPSLHDYVLIRSYAGYMSKDNVDKLRKAMEDIAKLFSELVETDPEVRENGEFTRVKISTVILPTKRESLKRLEN